MSMRRSLRRVKVGAMATVSPPRARAWMMVVVDRVAVTPMSARYSPSSEVHTALLADFSALTP
jgi:hypothetical protein